MCLLLVRVACSGCGSEMTATEAEGALVGIINLTTCLNCGEELSLEPSKRLLFVEPSSQEVTNRPLFGMWPEPVY